MRIWTSVSLAVDFLSRSLKQKGCHCDSLSTFGGAEGCQICYQYLKPSTHPVTTWLSLWHRSSVYVVDMTSSVMVGRAYGTKIITASINQLISPWKSFASNTLNCVVGMKMYGRIRISFRSICWNDDLAQTIDKLKKAIKYRDAYVSPGLIELTPVLLCR